MRDDCVRKTRCIINGCNRHNHFWWYLFVQLDVVFKGRIYRTEQGLDFPLLFDSLFNFLRLDQEIVRLVQKPADPRPSFAFDENLHRAIRQAKKLNNRR